MIYLSHLESTALAFLMLAIAGPWSSLRVMSAIEICQVARCVDRVLTTLVVDASVVINLNASGSAAEVLRAVPNPVLVVGVVIDELRVPTQSRRNDAGLLARLVGEGLIAEVSIEDLKQDHFERLVLGDDADTLDDGEAATIAYAVEK